MSRTSWANLSNVSGPSQYVLELARNTDSFMAILNPLVEQKKYLRNFYDKAAAYVSWTIRTIDVLNLREALSSRVSPMLLCEVAP